MKNLKKDNSGCVTVYSKCIEWTGPDIDCLGIKTGDCLNDLVFIVATKVCELANPMDLSGLSIQCVLDILNREEPAQRTLANILQLMIDAECHLKELIDAIIAQINGGDTPIVLNLGCLAEYDPYGNPLPYTEQSVLQRLINEVCSMKTTINNLSGHLTNLQAQVDAIDITPYVEPNISSCFFVNKPTSQAVKLTADELCLYRSVVGQVAQVQTAIGLQDTSFNAYYQTFPGWTAVPNTLAEAIGNMQIVLSDLFVRVAANEECCRTTCEDIKVGFEVVVNPDGDRITLIYTEVMGTFIPDGWEDIGSKLTITDEANRERVFHNLNVGQNTESEELDISGLSGILTMCLEVRLRNNDTNETCMKCECRTYQVTDQACPVCLVSASGTTGTVTIVYQEI